MEDEIRKQTQFGVEISEDQEDLETLQTTFGLIGTDAYGRPMASFIPFGGDETDGVPLSAITPKAQAISGHLNLITPKPKQQQIIYIFF